MFKKSFPSSVNIGKITTVAEDKSTGLSLNGEFELKDLNYFESAKTDDNPFFVQDNTLLNPHIITGHIISKNDFKPSGEADSVVLISPEKFNRVKKVCFVCTNKSFIYLFLDLQNLTHFELIDKTGVIFFDSYLSGLPTSVESISITSYKKNPELICDANFVRYIQLYEFSITNIIGIPNFDDRLYTILRTPTILKVNFTNTNISEIFYDLLKFEKDPLQWTHLVLNNTATQDTLEIFSIFNVILANLIHLDVSNNTLIKFFVDNHLSRFLNLEVLVIDKNQFRLYKGCLMSMKMEFNLDFKIKLNEVTLRDNSIQL